MGFNGTTSKRGLESNIMQKYIDAATILSEARMMWSGYQEKYILVEGETDRLFLNTVLGEIPRVRIRAVGGWELVYNTISQAQKEEFVQLLGIIDKDYHVINKDEITESKQLAFTDMNDIEMMLFMSKAYDKFLKICGSESKLKVCPDTRAIILSAAFFVGVLRSISLKNQYCFNFDGIECKDFVDKNNLILNLDKLVEKIIQRTRSNGTTVTVSNEEVKRIILITKEDKKAEEYCNGHDVMDIIGIAMTKVFASASSKEYSPEVIFNYLLMGYTSEEFQKSKMYDKINEWMLSDKIRV